jgi:DNA polymerase
MAPHHDQDPLFALSRDLRRYVGLLERCGLDWLVPGVSVGAEQTPAAPPAAADVVAAVVAAGARPIVAAVNQAMPTASCESSAAVEVPPPGDELTAEADEEEYLDPAPATDTADAPAPMLKAGVGNDLVEEVAPPPNAAETIAADAIGDGARGGAGPGAGEGTMTDDEPDLFAGAGSLVAAEESKRDDPDQLDMFAAGLSMGLEPGAPAAPSPAADPAAADPAATRRRDPDSPEDMPRPAKPKSSSSDSPAAASAAIASPRAAVSPPRQPAPPAPPEPPCAPASPRESIDAIAAEIAACTACPLATTRTNTVPGEGSPVARLMFIGEGPGANEDQQGRPFVGRAGQLLDKMIVAMGLAREEVFIANAVKCRPPDNRNPTAAECAACEHFLRRQIASIRPEAICLLGRVASQLILRTDSTMKALRGHWFEFEGIPVAVTYHPAYLLRSPGEKAKAWEDLQMVMVRLGLDPPAKA